MPFSAINWPRMKIVHLERSGSHLGNVDYENTLAVVAAPGRRHDEEVRADWSEPGTFGKKWG